MLRHCAILRNFFENLSFSLYYNIIPSRMSSIDERPTVFTLHKPCKVEGNSNHWFKLVGYIILSGRLFKSGRPKDRSYLLPSSS